MTCLPAFDVQVFEKYRPSTQLFRSKLVDYAIEKLNDVEAVRSIDIYSDPLIPVDIRFGFGLKGCCTCNDLQSPDDIFGG